MRGQLVIVIALCFYLFALRANADLFDGVFDGCDPLVDDCFQEKTGIEGRVLLISQATKWVGPAIAKYFADRGVKLVLFDDESAAASLQGIVGAIGHDRAVWHVGAADSEADQAAAFFAAEQFFHEPVSFVLINSERAQASGDGEADPIDVDLSHFTRSYHSGVIGPLITLRQAVSSFRRNGTPKKAIVFLSSILSLANRPDRRHLASSASGRMLSHDYLSTMAAFNSLAHSAGVTYEAEGIRIYNVLPGSYRMEPNGQETPLHLPENPVFPTSYGSPEELALIIEHLLSGTHSFLPGKMVLTDHDATFSASLWLESFEQDSGRHQFFADQVLDASGSTYYDFSKRSSAYVRSGHSADKMMELISKLLESEIE